MFVDRVTGRVFLTLLEVAKRWSMGEASVRQVHIKVGGLRADRIGNQWFVALADLTLYEQKRLGPSLDGRIKRLQKLRKRIAQPFMPPPVAAEGRA